MAAWNPETPAERRLEAVESQNALGIAVDLSHCGTDHGHRDRRVEQATAHHALGLPRGVISRNKEDRELKAMADKGGVGVYLMPFLAASPARAATNEDALARHIDHALNDCGVDHVGIGSDLSITPIEETPEYQVERAFADGRAARKSAAPGLDRVCWPRNHPRRLEGVAGAAGPTRGTPLRP